MPALTPEQESLKQAALAAIEPHKGKPLKAIAKDADEYHWRATPPVILTLLAQLEAAPSVPVQAGTVAQANNAALQALVDQAQELDMGYGKAGRAMQPVQTVPDVLFDGYAVYDEIASKLGKGHRISAAAVSATLDAAVRLIRAARAAPGESGQ